MITQTNAVAFRQNPGEMLNLVQYRHDSVLIHKDGKPVAALVDARPFDHPAHAGAFRCPVPTHPGGLCRSFRIRWHGGNRRGDCRRP